MVTNSQMVLILALFQVLFAPLAKASNGNGVAAYLRETRFQSGYQASESCEWRLTSGAPAFRKKPLREQILELHARTHDVVVTAYDLGEALPLGPEALQEFSVRMRMVGEASKKQLQPYRSELLAMAFEAGALTHMSHRYETMPLQNLAVFFEKVVDMAEPTTDMERVFAVSAAASLANIRSTMIERSKDPAVRLRSTLEVLVKAAPWANHNPDTVFPLINSSLASTHKAILSLDRVPKDQRAAYIGMTELLFAGADTMLKQMGARGVADIERPLGILMRIHVVPDLNKDFPKIEKAIQQWILILGAEDDADNDDVDDTDPSPKTN